MRRRPVAWDLVASSGSLSTSRDVDGFLERIEILERLGVLETMVAELAVLVSGSSLALRPPARRQIGSSRAECRDCGEVVREQNVEVERAKVKGRSRKCRGDKGRRRGGGSAACCWKRANGKRKMNDLRA